MANFEYIDENEAAALEAQRVAAENKSSAGERASYWEELLKDKFEVQQAEELNALGKRKRSRKQVCVFKCSPVFNCSIKHITFSFWSTS